MNKKSNIVIQESNNGISRIKLNQPENYNALSLDMQMPVFKNSNEWSTDLKSPEYFLNLLTYGGPFLMDFIELTNVSVILDRFYPCEYTYSIAMGRETNMSTIHYLDNKFASIGGKFIFCFKTDYSKLVDDKYPDDLSVEKLKDLHLLYWDFLEWTKCEVLPLETDDMNLENQLKKIKIFLEK